MEHKFFEENEILNNFPAYLSIKEYVNKMKSFFFKSRYTMVSLGTTHTKKMKYVIYLFQTYQTAKTRAKIHVKMFEALFLNKVILNQEAF